MVAVTKVVRFLDCLKSFFRSQSPKSLPPVPGARAQAGVAAREQGFLLILLCH